MVFLPGARLRRRRRGAFLCLGARGCFYPLTRGFEAFSRALAGKSTGGEPKGKESSLPCSAPHVSVIVAIGGKDYCVQHRKKAEDMVIEDNTERDQGLLDCYT